MKTTHTAQEINDKLYSLKNYRQICATYVPPTNNSGSAVRIFEPARGVNERTKSKTFGYNYEFSDVAPQALEILLRNGIKVVCRTSDANKYIFLCDNWGEDFKEIKDLI